VTLFIYFFFPCLSYYWYGEGSLALILVLCPQMFSPRLRLLVAYYSLWLVIHFGFLFSVVLITVLTDLILLLLKNNIFIQTVIE